MNDIIYIYSNLNIKNFFEAIFYITVSVVTVMTYIQAKKSIFIPIKTEVLKLQLELFKEILIFFQNKDEVDFSKQLGFEELIYINYVKILDRYSLLFFDKDFSKKANIDIKNIACGARYTLEAANRDLRHTSYKKFKNDNEITVVKKTYDQKIKEWRTFTHDVFLFGHKYYNSEIEIENFLNSPILPQKIKKEILNFKNIRENNINILCSIFTEIYKDIPDFYPTFESLFDFDTGKVHNTFVRKSDKIKYKPMAEKILNTINKYLSVKDNIC